MRILIFLIVLSISVSISPQEKKIMSDVEKKLEEIRLKHIPDKRVAVFHINVIEEGASTVISGATNISSVKNEIEETFSGSKYQTKIDLLPSKDLGPKLFGVVNLSVANIRTKPDHAAELSTQALLGQPVNVLQKRGGWYLVQTPDKYIGWADDDGIELMDEKELMQWKTANKIIYVKDFGSSYSGNDNNSLPVSDLVKGNILKKISEENDRVKVEYPDKRIAYVQLSDVEGFKEYISSIDPSEENIIKTANKLMGIPYLWGGTSVKGMDCSGFTKTVYYMNGYILPRDASQQVNSGDVVDISNGYSNLQPGDLLFFGARGTDSTKERVTHVAIYIGDGDFIHASGRIKINSLDKSKDIFSAYRFNSFLRAKRILNSENREGIFMLKDLFNINGMQP
jgi:gamma-D-glutamyl-L-lysine dipeptidyl-peptidase